MKQGLLSIGMICQKNLAFEYHFLIQEFTLPAFRSIILKKNKKNKKNKYSLFPVIIMLWN